MSEKKLPKGITRRRNAYRVRVQYKGKQHEIGQFDSLRVAKLALERYQAEAVLGTFMSPADQRRELRRQRALQKEQQEREALERMTVAQWSSLWLDSLTQGLDPRSPSTVASYASAIRAHILPSIGPRPLASLTEDDITRMVTAAAKHGPGAARNTFTTTRSMLNAAVKVQAGGLKTSPVPAGFKPPRPRRREGSKVPTVQDVKLIAEAMGEPYGLAVELAAWCQLRLGEVLGLQRHDFTNLDDPARALVQVRRQWLSKGNPPQYGPPKDDSFRTIAVPPSLAPKVQAHLDRHVHAQGDAPVFPSPLTRTRPVSHQAIGRRWNQAKATVAPHATFHGLRHLGLSLFSRAGGTLQDTMRRGGHRDVESSMVYQHGDMDRDRELARQLDEIVTGS